jgi:hypothetical protein
MAKAFWEKEIMAFGDKSLQVPENIIEFVDANVLAGRSKLPIDYSSETFN